MGNLIRGGRVSYGQLVGILMADSLAPRIPGDPGHAETFPFPVRYGVVRGFPFQDLVDIRTDHLDLVIEAAQDLERAGVAVVAADCGLFSIYQRQVADALNVPFLGSALSLIPFLSSFLPAHLKIGLITGDTRLLKKEHLAAAGAEESRTVVRGMETCEEFVKVVIEGGQSLDVERMRAGVVQAADSLADSGEPLGAVVLECTNLVSFRLDVQERLGLPVFDAVSLIEFFAEGFRRRGFVSRYLEPSRS